jgi:FixJ family two-component response regulator
VVDLRPDVMLIEIRLPGISGVRAIERRGLLAPASRVLVLTRSEENRVIEATLAGASGYVVKTAPPKAIIAAVRAPAAGESVLSPQIAGKLLQRIREREIPITANSQDAATAIRAALTERELDISTRLASGKSNHDIAHRALAQTQHRPQPHRPHPRQAPPREPHPSSRSSHTERHFLTLLSLLHSCQNGHLGADAGRGRLGERRLSLAA